ncbi:MAG: radical SAM family heme chaperone HemW [Fusobacteriaceae bacterium]
MNAIYIHMPFCLKKCSYCDFLSFSGSKKNEREKYVDYLIKEINLYPGNIYDTIYFGGGTPSIFEPEQIKRILEVLKKKEGAEITLETNPKTVDYQKLLKFKKAGVNRLSIGVQSFNEKHLKNLGRLHKAQEAENIYLEARRAGFENISLDLMFSLPEQTPEELKYDLNKIFQLKPEHFSIYSLIWEEGTEFFKKLEEGKYKETENELEAEMYRYIIEESQKQGYIHYEISNFSLPGKESRHNSKYWKNSEYLGIGLGASGYFKDIRYKNIENFTEYYDMIDDMKRPVSEIETVDENEREIYRNILGLRLLQEGVDPSEKHIELFRDLEKRGYLKQRGKNYVLTEKGIFFANDVFSEMI